MNKREKHPCNGCKTGYPQTRSMLGAITCRTCGADEIWELNHPHIKHN